MTTKMKVQMGRGTVKGWFIPQNIRGGILNIRVSLLLTFYLLVEFFMVGVAIPTADTYPEPYRWVRWTIEFGKKWRI